jgi:hypothetical protein
MSLSPKQREEQIVEHGLYISLCIRSGLCQATAGERLIQV